MTNVIDFPTIFFIYLVHSWNDSRKEQAKALNIWQTVTLCMKGFVYFFTSGNLRQLLYEVLCKLKTTVRDTAHESVMNARGSFLFHGLGNQPTN
jgi:hypothetical protein